MVREVITIQEEDNLLGLMQGMDQFHVRHLPVVHGKQLVGMLSHRDMLGLSVSTLDATPASQLNDARLKEGTFAASVMTRDVVTVGPETQVLQAVRLMLANKFGCLPVVDGSGDLIGIVSEFDLLKQLASRLHDEAPEERLRLTR